MRTSGAVLACHIAFVIVTVGCGATRTTATPCRLSAQSYDAEELGASEIDSVRANIATAYDLIRWLRPAMLNPRMARASTPLAQHSATTGSGLGVYLDAVYVGGPEVLATIPARTVRSIRRLSMASASVEYGTQAFEGVIVITTAAPLPNRRLREYASDSIRSTAVSGTCLLHGAASRIDPGQQRDRLRAR